MSEIMMKDMWVKVFRLGRQNYVPYHKPDEPHTSKIIQPRQPQDQNEKGYNTKGTQ